MNKVERVEAVFRNEKADVVPAGFWFHYNHEWDTPTMAEAHIKTFRETGMDIMKVMQDYTIKLDTQVKTPSDWKKVKFPGTSSQEFQKLTDVLKRILDNLGGEALVFQTMYGPFKAAVISWGDALLMAHSREDPAAVAAAIGGIAESLAEWAVAFVEAGATGLYYAAQFSEPGRFTKPEWEKLVKSADIAVLNAAEKQGGRNILHICGEPEYQFVTNPQWFTDYPAAIVNWSVKDTGLSLSAGRDIFKKPILGGLNNKGHILSGSDADIAGEVRQVIRDFGEKGLMVGADCTIQGKGISHEKIRAAVDAAHNYR